MAAFFRRKKDSPPPPPEPSYEPGDEVGQTTYISGDSQRDTDRVRLIIESLRAVSSEADSDALLTEMVDRAVRTVGAERGLLFTRGSDQQPRLRVARAADGSDLPKGTTWSSQVVESVLEGGTSVCKNEDDGGDFDPSQSMISLDIRAVMCVPLVFQEKRQGVIYVDARASERPFTHSDLRFFEAFADMLSIVWTNRLAIEEQIRTERLRADVELARELQGSLLPSHPLQEKGFSMCGICVPADEAGGDYFDFFRTKEGLIAMAVGDVSGHGVGPALFMTGARAYVRAYAQSDDSPRRIMRRVNRHLVGDMGDDMFMSMFVCILDPATHEFHYANAGHPPPILIHGKSADAPEGKQRVEDYKLTGMALGVEAAVDWAERGPYKLLPGDTVVMFTDGILELRDGDEQFGRDRLRASVEKYNDGTAEELLAGIIQDLKDFAGEDNLAQDDITLAILRADA